MTKKKTVSECLSKTKMAGQHTESYKDKMEIMSKEKREPESPLICSRKSSKSLRLWPDNKTAFYPRVELESLSEKSVESSD